jgi:glutamate-1-semialdehyde 2,1-aminomutase
MKPKNRALSTERSRKYFQAAQTQLVGGVDSPVRAFRAVGGTPLFFLRGKGPFLMDADGNRYLDLVGSWGPLILGHGDKDVLNAVRRTLRKGLTFGAPSPLETDLAVLVKRAFPSIDKVRFVSSGTEAVMGALRLSRAATGKKRILKFDGCYHGHGDSLLVAAGSGAATLGLPDSPGVPEEFASLTTSLPYNDPGAVAQAFEKYSDIAAVIVEPVAGNMGLVPPKPGFLEGLREITSRRGALLVFDEVMTGFRVAWGGAQERYGVKPDLTTLGKILGGGMPVGAYGGRGDLMSRVAPEGPVYQAGTLSGNPVAMAAGIATLKKLREPALYRKLEEAGAFLEEGVRRALAKTALEASFQRVGSMATLFFRKGPVENYAQASQSDRRKFAAFFWAMVRRGVYLPPSQFEVWFLSAVLSGDQLRKIVKAVGESLEETQRNG